MRRFLVKTFIFVSPLLCLFLYLEVSLRRLPNSYATKRQYLEQGLATTEVLLSGSSHEFYGIRPSLLAPHTFSIAYVSQDLYYDTHLILLYLDRMPKLTTVIIPVSYRSLESQLDVGTESWRVPFYYCFYGIPARERKFTLANFSYLALYGYDAARTIMIDGPPKLDIGSDGGFENSTSEPGSAEKLAEVQPIVRHHSAMRREFLGPNVSALEQTLAALQHRGIRAVFVTTPVYKTYSQAARPETYRRMQDALGELCRRYGVQYFNHMQDSRFTAADFNDIDHLDREGAEKFSLILHAEIFAHEPGGETAGSVKSAGRERPNKVGGSGF